MEEKKNVGVQLNEFEMELIQDAEKKKKLLKTTSKMRDRIVQKLAICNFLYSVPEELTDEIIDLVYDMRDKLLEI